ADVLHMLLAVQPRHAPVDAHLAGSRIENAAERLDGRRLAGAVGADVANNFSLLNAERDMIDGAQRLILTREKIEERAADAFAAVISLILFDEILDDDQRFRHARSLTADTAMRLSFLTCYMRLFEASSPA